MQSIATKSRRQGPLRLANSFIFLSLLVREVPTTLLSDISLTFLVLVMGKFNVNRTVYVNLDSFKKPNQAALNSIEICFIKEFDTIFQFNRIEFSAIFHWWKPFHYPEYFFVHLVSKLKNLLTEWFWRTYCYRIGICIHSNFTKSRRSNSIWMTGMYCLYPSTTSS